MPRPRLMRKAARKESEHAERRQLLRLRRSRLCSGLQAQLPTLVHPADSDDGDLLGGVHASEQECVFVVIGQRQG